VLADILGDEGHGDAVAIIGPLDDLAAKQLCCRDRGLM